MAVAESVLVEVNREKCERVAQLLKSVLIPNEEEQSSLPHLDHSLVANFYLALVAICHQTSPMGLPPLEGVVGGTYRRGWEYLFARFEDAVVHDPSLITPHRLSQTTQDEVRSIFFDSDSGDRITRPELRAELLRNLGQVMLNREWATAQCIYEHCGGRISHGTPNLLDTLGQFRAYRDPVRKKSLFFLSLMKTAGIWHYQDECVLGTPVDYHEVRGHLRIGTVQINDESLRRKLVLQHEVTESEDILIRQAVYDAIMKLSELTGYSPSRLHYFFWNVFRAICIRLRPKCFDAGSAHLPIRYEHLLSISGGCACPFSTICNSAGQAVPIVEHVFETDFY